MRFRAYALPLLLAALTLRGLIPFDVAPSAQGFTLQASMCSQDRGKTEIIEVPGEKPVVSHCEYCVAPLLGAPPLAISRPTPPTPIAFLCAEQPESVAFASPLPRAQSARAPPFAS
jgi:hypothetical protein